MPLEDSVLSREPDGSLNEEYCKWCYTEGKFAYSSLEELLDFLEGTMSNESWTPKQVRTYLQGYLPQLKHWKMCIRDRGAAAVAVGEALGDAVEHHLQAGVVPQNNLVRGDIHHLAENGPHLRQAVPHAVVAAVIAVGVGELTAGMEGFQHPQRQVQLLGAGPVSYTHLPPTASPPGPSSRPGWP